MAVSDLLQRPATELARLVRSGELTSRELVEASLERIEALDGRVNAFCHLHADEALGAADAIGPGDPRPFAGVPIAMKTEIPVAGSPLTMGSRLFGDFTPAHDAFAARRLLRDAGGGMVGRTSMPELGIMPVTEPTRFGPTRNPWDLERTPGGSSGGSAAAVAAGMVPIAHANDGGGSIRIPASECGLVGLKPTRQRISEGPMIGDNMSGLTAELVVSRSVRDTAAILEAVHGPAPGDPYVAPPPSRPYTEEVGADPGQLRIGLLTEPLLEAESNAVVAEAARDAGRLLESLGHAIEESHPGGFEEMDIVDTFLTRWMAGQTAALDQFQGLIGREIGSDDVEPLTWALAEEGRR